MSTRVVVVGGGIIAACQAYACQQRGLQTLWLGPTLGVGAATYAAAGMLAPLGEAEDESPSVWPMLKASREFFDQFIDALGADSRDRIDYRDCGALWVSVTVDQKELLLHQQERLARRGIHVKSISTVAARELEPQLTPKLSHAFYAPGEASLNPVKLVSLLEERFLAKGGIRSIRVVDAIEQTKQSHWLLKTQGQIIETERLVLAMGVETESILKPLGISLGLRPVKGQSLFLRKGPNLQRIIKTPDVYVVNRGNRLVVGATEEARGFDRLPTAGAIMELLAKSWRVVPDLYEAIWDEVRVGLRPATRSRAPIVQDLNGNGLWVHTGHFRNGILWGPWLATQCAEAIKAGRHQVAPEFSLESSEVQVD